MRQGAGVGPGATDYAKGYKPWPGGAAYGTKIPGSFEGETCDKNPFEIDAAELCCATCDGSQPQTRDNAPTTPECMPVFIAARDPRNTQVAHLVLDLFHM